MKNRVVPFIEYVSEATAACLVAMVQGNLLAVTFGHLVVASQTGIVAGACTTAALFISNAEKRWLVAMVLAVATATVDFYVHPGRFGSVATEAIVTGACAGLFSYVIGSAISYVRGARATG
jgi:hypothetical protein